MPKLFEGTKSLNLTLSILLIIVGGVGVVLHMDYLANMANIAIWVDIMLEGGSTGAAACLTGLQTGLYGLFIVAAMGVLGLISALAKLRFVFIISLVLALIGGVMALLGGVGYQPLDTYLGTDMILPNPTVNFGGPAVAPEGIYKEMQHMGIAGFQKCCFEQGWHDQTAVLECDAGICPELLDERILLYESFGLDKICTCKTDVAMYDKFHAAYSNETCAIMEDMIIPWDEEREIPVIYLALDSILEIQHPGIIIKGTPMVGYNRDAESDPTGETPVGFGFGCGIGYAKGWMWMTQLWFQYFAAGAATAQLGMGGGAIAVCLFGMLLGMASAQEDKGGNYDDIDGATGLDQVEKETFTAITANNPQISKQDSFDEATPAVAKPNGGGNDGAMGASTELKQQLRDFYAKYDQSKTEGDVVNVANWGARKGMAALNAKLRERYPGDLSTMEKDVEKQADDEVEF